MNLFDIGILEIILVRMGIVGYVLEPSHVDWYDNIIMENRPSKESIEAEFALYEQELADAEAAEIARVNDIKARWAAISDISGALLELGYSAQNNELLLRDIIAQDNQELLAQIETAWTSFQAKIAAETSKENRRKVGENNRKCCTEVLEVISGWTDQNGMDEAQVDQFVENFAAINTALKDWRGTKSKTLINAVEPDGVIVTAAMKSEVLSIFEKYGI